MFTSIGNSVLFLVNNHILSVNCTANIKEKSISKKLFLNILSCTNFCYGVKAKAFHQ